MDSLKEKVGEIQPLQGQAGHKGHMEGEASEGKTGAFPACTASAQGPR